MLRLLVASLSVVLAISAPTFAASGPTEDESPATSERATPDGDADGDASATDSKDSAEAPPPTLEELVELLQKQQKQIQDQQQLIEAQQTKIDEMSALLMSVHRRLEESVDEPPDLTISEALEKRIQAIEVATDQNPELEQPISTGDFPASIRIPGTDAAIRIGGRVKLSVVHSLDALGSDDRFLTHSIPVGVVDGDSGNEARVNLHARASRLYFDFRTPSGVGYVRAFIEGDFDAGAERGFRLRHAFGQFGRHLLGRTWSTFSDPRADPEDIDFEGLNSLNTLRTAQFRGTWKPREDLSLAFAVENASASITGGASVNQIPDFIGRAIYTGGFGHVQLAAVTRQIRGDPDDDENDVVGKAGGGLALSGKLSLPWLHRDDTLSFSISGGQGVARYITDLSSLGGHDAVFDPVSGRFEVYPAIAWYLGLQHYWSKRIGLRSSFVWGHVDVSNFDFEPSDAYDRTERLSLNMIWSPITRLELGLEFIYGTRTDKDETSGHARQIQIMSQFTF